MARRGLDAWEGRSVTSGESKRLSREAFRVTLVEGDLARCQEALRCETPLVRELAVIGVGRFADGDALEATLRPLLEDPDEAVQMGVAILLAPREVRACLTTFASLLDSEVFHIRNQSHEILTAMTDEDFGFYSDGLVAERRRASKFWQRWVAKFGDKAPIRFENVRPWLEENGGE